MDPIFISVFVNEPRGINNACAFCTWNMEAEKEKVLVITFVSKYILIIIIIKVVLGGGVDETPIGF